MGEGYSAGQVIGGFVSKEFSDSVLTIEVKEKVKENMITHDYRGDVMNNPIMEQSGIQVCEIYGVHDLAEVLRQFPRDFTVFIHNSPEFPSKVIRRLVADFENRTVMLSSTPVEVE